MEALDTELKAFSENFQAFHDNLQSELTPDDIPQIQLVWDNINLRSKHRFERMKDNYDDCNYDWMASLWIMGRINASHMSHVQGKAVKQPHEINIQDFIPALPELNYVFTSLVLYYAKRLTLRHPELFKSINSNIKVRKHTHTYSIQLNGKWF